MKKLVPVDDDWFKLGEKILVPFKAFDEDNNGQSFVNVDTNTTATFYIKNASGLVKSIPAVITNGGATFNIDTSQISDLTPDSYFTELWLVNQTNTTIYPDNGFTALVINENATAVKGEVLPELSLQAFEEELKKYIENVLGNEDSNNNSGFTIGNLKSLLMLFQQYYQVDAQRSSIGVSAHNYYDPSILPLYNYQYTDQATAYYPFNSESGSATVLSPIPLDKACANSGIQIDFDLVTTASGGTFNVTLPDFKINLATNSIKQGTNHYSFFAQIGNMPASQTYVDMGLCLHDYSGQLGIKNLLVRVNNTFVNYQSIYNNMVTTINQTIGNQADSQPIDINNSDLNQAITNYLLARDQLTNNIEQGLSANINSNHDILTVTNNNIGKLGSAVLTIDPTKVKGGNVSAFGNMNYQNIQTQAQALNLNTVTVSLPVRVNSLTDSNCITTDDDWNKVKTDVQHLQALGLRILIQPYPYIANGSAAEVDWTPDDVPTFFKTYGAIINQIAQYAQTVKLDGMYIATNLVHLEQYEDNWITLIQQVKATYTGKIYFRTNWWRTASWSPDTLTAYQATLNRKFWADVDVIAIAAYFEVTDTQNPSSQQLQTDLYSVPYLNRQQDIVSQIKAFNDKWHKPIFFGELGIPPYSDGAEKPYNAQMDSNGKYSELLQSNWFDAWYTVFSQFNWWLGYSIFEIDSTSPYNPYGKLAQSTIEMQTFGGAKKPTTYLQSETPLAPNQGDVWLVSDNSTNITAIKKWNGSEWQTFKLSM